MPHIAECQSSTVSSEYTKSDIFLFEKISMLLFSHENKAILIIANLTNASSLNELE